MAIRGQPQEEGGQYKEYYCGYLGLPLGQPLDAPWIVAGHVLEAYTCSI